MTASLTGPYDIDGVIPGTPLESVPAGTNLLLTGTDETGATDLFYRILSVAPSRGESVVLVGTADTPRTLAERYRSTLPAGGSLDHLRIVDAAESGLDQELGPLSPTQVESAASPADITAIGIGITNHLRSGDVDRTRLGVNSLSPIIDGIGPERTFAFLHVLTSRVRMGDHLGLFLVDPTRHADEEVRIMRSLTDGVFDFQCTDAGDPVVRGAGVVSDVDDWTPIS